MISTRPPRVLALCADDFGLTPGISAGIAQLARAQRLTAISCITNSPHWEKAAARLEGLPATVEVGLHFNLTEGAPLSHHLRKRWPRSSSLVGLILRAHLGLLPRRALSSEAHAQLAAFIGARGGPPQFIDGHQHVHHLPGVRALILDMAEHLQPLPALRSTARVLGPGFAFKRLVIERSGGRALGRALALRALAHNPVLLGVYDFADTDYRGLVQRWLAGIPPEGALLFCHPGEASGTGRDPIDAARERELAYLESSAFTHDLAAAGVTLGRVWRTVAPPA
ncbi:MAG: ChbG/HpnK family deacetylase [Burkholderiaceae bacterium]